MVSETELHELLLETARSYPPELIADQVRDLPRALFHVQLVLDNVGRQARFADVGGGIGMFSVACARLGMRPILIDDFRDPVNVATGHGILDLHRRNGVEVISTDVVEELPRFEDGSLDAVTCFDSMEHWHRSPRPVFMQLVRALRPGGLFVLSGPNCVNLRKRLTTLAGRGKWSSMADWYHQDLFRGHVREPDVDDLLYIARDLGLERVRLYGRNWLGLAYPSALIRTATRALDPLLRLRPSLCADIYLVGFRPGP